QTSLPGTVGIKLNQNFKIMDRKELKDKIDELRSTAKMELACTIREIMRGTTLLWDPNPCTW
ncbi:hypothetical protein RFY10_02125, partial [Acinetobacter baumannii]|nr:hypothetical protein [Acinetobacter baumannii]